MNKTLLLLLCSASMFAGDLFDKNGALTPVFTKDNVDTKKSVAIPGNTPVKPGVIRVNRKGHHRPWSTASTGELTDCHFVIALKRPQAVGSVLVVGRYDVSFLRPGASLDAMDDANWTKVRYPGEARRAVRIVPLPKGTMTSALRLSGPGNVDKSGKFRRSVSLASAFAGRYVNITPMAELRTSSTAQTKGGFRPNPRQANPETLVDGSLMYRNWSSAQRDKPITADKPETIILDWHKPQTMRGCVFLIGAHESGAGSIVVQRFIGKGDPDETVDAQWQTITTIKPLHPWRPPHCWEAAADFGKDVTTRALRFVMPAGLPKEQAKGGREGVNPKGISFGEIVVLQDLHDSPAPKSIKRRGGLPAGVLPITFQMPAKGKASIRIVNGKGEIVKNLINGQAFEAGEQTVLWDLATIDDYFPPFALPTHPHYRKGALKVGELTRTAAAGKYRWEGIWHPGLKFEYLYSFYPLKKHNLAWITADNTGGWLADHNPPETLVRVGNKMWVGTFCEAGQAILEADLDMRKLWGSNRIWLACPRVMAASGDKVYYLEQGGWAKKVVMIEIDTKTKRSRRLTGRDKAKDEKIDIQGLAVVGTRAFFSNMATGEVTVIDISANLKARPAGFGWNKVYKVLEHEKMKVLKTLKIAKPSRIRPYDANHLALVSDKSVLLLKLNDYKIKPLITGLTNPRGLAIDAAKNVYVGEMKPVHQVKVFNASSKLVRTFGKPGPHKIGAFDNDNLESPAGVEVDAKGNVWVCELNHELKRTSVWDKNGKCINQVLGPTLYGGGGDIDPQNGNRFFYKGKEFLRDPKTKKIKLVKQIWRGDNDEYDRFFKKAGHNFGGASPAYPFYNGGKLFFTSWQGWAAGANTTLWLYDDDRVRPVAAIGSLPPWIRKKFGIGKDDPRICAWTDANDDGKVQKEELRTGEITYDGKPWNKCGATWQFRMNQKFEAAVSDGSYNAAGLAWYRVEKLSDKGFPIYKLPTAFHKLPFRGLDHAADGVFTDRHGNGITLDEYVVSMKPDGTVNWRYKNRWPGLHSGHHTTARGNEPGVLIATTRFLGSGIANDAVGEVICIGSNLGSTHLFTEDGFYVDNAFQDTRVGLAWRMNTPPSPEVLAKMSLGDEHFGGTLNYVKGEDGKYHFRFVVGQPHCSVVEMRGLDKVASLPGGQVTVTNEHLAKAEELRLLRARKTMQRKEYTIRKMAKVVIDGNSKEWPKERIDGFALGYDDTNLYVLFSGRDDRAPFKNATTDTFLECFKKGDVVDVKLETKAGGNAKRTAGAEGDIRLSFTQVQGKPTAILYDFVVPGTPKNAKLSFSSPWRTIYIDRVSILAEAKIAVIRKGNNYTLEAAVPLKSIHLDPKATPVIRGDVGRVHSDQTGTRAVGRTYWSNKNTNITADVPSEAMIQPSLWGKFRFE